ncbi:MAG: M56 family metallopeptidase [Chthoniobacterales bacterium]
MRLSLATSLLELTLRGSLVTILILCFDVALRNQVRPSWRRLWWMLSPIAFLAPFHVSFLLPQPSAPANASHGDTLLTSSISSGTDRILSTLTPSLSMTTLVSIIWLSGVCIFLGIVILRTALASRRWGGRRLTTESEILTQLENCKAESGVTAPIGMVIAEDVPCPAILGWLRPRLLMPKTFFEALSGSQRRHILLHELAHFRKLDVPANWLFTLAQALHWFNPLAYIAASHWRKVCEESADEAALQIMQAESGEAYGKTLLHTLGQFAMKPQIHGAFAISESNQTLKRRIHMLTKYPYRKNNSFFIIAVSALLLVTTLLQIGRAETTEDDKKKDALAATMPWLGIIDRGNYAQSYKDASQLFKKAVTEAKWVDALNKVRKPLGTCLSRKVATQSYQSEVPLPSGTLKGDFVITQFESSFQNLKAAMETVTFEKEADGTWRVSGYYIKPR